MSFIVVDYELRAPYLCQNCRLDPTRYQVDLLQVLVPGTQIQQAVIILTLGCSYDLFGSMFKNVSETLFEISFLCDSALICETNDLNFNVALLKLGCHEDIEGLGFRRLFLAGRQLLGCLMLRLIVHCGCQILKLAFLFKSFLVLLKICD